MAETILIPPDEWQVIRIDEYKRLTTENNTLKLRLKIAEQQMKLRQLERTFQANRHD